MKHKDFHEPQLIPDINDNVGILRRNVQRKN